MDLIDNNWVRTTFPHVCEAWGDAYLDARVQAYNAAVAEADNEDIEPSVIAAKIGRTQPPAHIGLLNQLSIAKSALSRVDGDPFERRFCTPLLLLEKRLGQLAKLNIRPSTYQSMARSPTSFYSLIAEVDVAASLSEYGGTVDAHVPTSAVTKSDYDVRWARPNSTLHGDVKWFETWLLKDNREILDALSQLLSADIEFHVDVAVMRDSAWPGVEAEIATEVIELYRVAVGAIPVPPSVAVATSEDGNVRQAHRVGFEVPPVHFVRSVTVHANRPGRGSFMVTTSATAAAGTDSRAARANIQGAARQVPPSVSDRDVSVIFIGSAAPTDASDVEEVLFDSREIDYSTATVTTVPGFFSAGTPERALEHIDAVFFFSIVFDADRFGVPRADREVRLFTRTPSPVGRKLKCIRTVERALRRTVSLGDFLY